MTDFSLIKQLEQKPAVKEAPLLPEGVKYEEYIVETMDAGEKTVYIPARAADAFEEALSEYTIIVHADLKKVMREHRGIGKV